MKRITVLFFALLITGCSLAVNPFEDKSAKKEILYYGLDLRKYSEKDFFFTTETYRGDYTPVGFLEISILPEIKKNPDAKFPETVWLPEEVKYAEILDSLYSQATYMGADAVINLRFLDDYGYNWGDKYWGKKITGFAIKRK